MAKKNKSRTKGREPFEYNPPFESEELPEEPRPKYKTVLAYLLDQDEVNRLINASNTEYVELPHDSGPTDYSTYTRDECAALINGKPHQRKTKKKK